MSAPQAQTSYRTRVVLFGASNLALYLPRVVSMARGALDGPLEIFVACGLGRSYGEWTSVLSRELPGIGQAGLWDALCTAHAERPLPTVALAVDVGNDLVYGVQAERVAGWVATCLDRLSEIEARTTLALLPMPSIEALGKARFNLVRSILFPSHNVRLDGVRDQARTLQRQLRAIADERGLCAVEQQGEWYGLDPIHIRMLRAGPAWSTILGAWGPASAEAALTRSERTRVRRGRPATRRVRGRTREREQPSVRLDDGSAILMF